MWASRGPCRTKTGGQTVANRCRRDTIDNEYLSQFFRVDRCGYASGETVEQLVFGFASPDEAVRAIDEVEIGTTRTTAWSRRLVTRLQAYADGGGDDFRDVKVLDRVRTPFQQDVLKDCRRIPYGRTLCYSELADAAGYPQAARAVGQRDGEQLSAVDRAMPSRAGRRWTPGGLLESSWPGDEKEIACSRSSEPRSAAQQGASLIVTAVIDVMVKARPMLVGLRSIWPIGSGQNRRYTGLETDGRFGKDNVGFTACSVVSPRPRGTACQCATGHDYGWCPAGVLLDDLRPEMACGTS